MVFFRNSETKHNIILLSFLLLTSLLSPSNFAYALDSEEASTLIRTGENALISTFENVLRADNLGVNVSNLILKLNEATDLLERAEVSLAKGILNDVLNLTSHSIGLMEEVNKEAVRLRLAKLTQRESEFRFNLILIIVGISSFIFFMLLLWRWFKGYYLHKVLNSKPEVS